MWKAPDLVIRDGRRQKSLEWSLYRKRSRERTPEVCAGVKYLFETHNGDILKISSTESVSKVKANLRWKEVLLHESSKC